MIQSRGSWQATLRPSCETSGNKYTGTFTITQLAPDGKTVQVVIKGLIKAYRVTIDTDEQT